ncbi:MAG: transcription termination factor Rho [Bilifractor sp.]|jgi:transcription termination factor Rho
MESFMDSFIMKQRYESLPLKELRAIAKQRGIDGISALRKGALIDRLLEEDEKDRQMTGQNDSRNFEEAADVSVPQEVPNAVEEGDGEFGKNTAAENPDKPKKTSRKTADKTDAAPRSTRRTAGKTGMTGRTRQTGRRSGQEDADRTHQTTRQTTRQSVQENTDRSVERKSRSVRNTSSVRNASPRNRITDSEDRNTRESQNADQPQQRQTKENRSRNSLNIKPEIRELDTGESVRGVLEIMTEGYGFLRSENFLPGEDDVYVSPSQIRKFRLRTGDMVTGNVRSNSGNEKYNALLYVTSVNDEDPEKAVNRPAFETLVPVFPDERIRLEHPGGSTAMRIVDLVSPIGKGQRGLIVSPPKAGKTTLLKQMAQAVLANNPEMHVMILLIDERPEEVTDMIDTVTGMNVEVLFSTFDELPEHHKKVAEMTIERAKRMVEAGRDVIIFTDSITRLARANNQVVPPSGRTLSGGLDPAALHMPKKFFGAARNIRGGGSLTILATALVDTGSKMDDVVYEEFKGTGNMELFLDRKLQERRVFPAIDLARSGTRREDLLLTPDEQEAVTNMRRALVGMRAEEAGENILNMFAHTKNNRDLVMMLRKSRII